MGEQQDPEKKEFLEKRSKGTSFEPDLIWEVLSRLPSKSIVQSRCVSKLCSSITTQPGFIRSFAARSSESPCLLILFKDKGNMFVFSLPQQQKHNLNSNNHVAVVDSYSMPCPGKYHFLSSESVHGLICVEEPSGNPQVWNPTTRRFSTLPKPARRWGDDDRVSFVGYDPVDCTYKVLSMPCRRPRQPRALTLGGGGEGGARWRVIKGLPEHAPFRRGARCVNGVLYYLAAPTLDDHRDNQFLVSFHVRSEKLSMMQVPWNLTRGLRQLLHCEGKLICVISNGGDDIIMWTLEDAEKHKWSYKHLLLPFSRRDPVARTRFSLKGSKLQKSRG
ncbi:hypothetical protein EUTSA_v10027600mg [Eutrema salsugineum]|uniref:Uncharacterized protein n=1 Tax=Eutrema salsugineum TaxID=72664 RepID=V4MCN7_EUTSA|nr:hypothetical protein EUTSA_v10027600mg [Eutrema salsugineum]